VCRLWYWSARRSDALHDLRHADRRHGTGRLRAVAVRDGRRLEQPAVAVRVGGELERRRPSVAGAGGALVRRKAAAFKVIIIGALVVVIAALIAIVALPRLFSTVDPQKYVGTWAYTGNAADRIVITRQGGAFTIVFVGQNGTRQSLPGKIADKRLVIDFAALGPDGKIVKKLAESIGAKLSFSYRKSDDRLLLSGANANQGSFTIVMQRSSPA
jgi:hypothetical protein